MSRAKAVFLYMLMASSLVACGGGSGGSFNAVPRGSSPEAPLNSTTVLDQQRPVSAGNRRDRAVVMWESFGQDGSHFGIFGRRLRNGQPEGEEFRANSFTTGRQSFPSVGMDADGNFLVAWRSSLQTSAGGNIFAQRFAADGSRRGTEFQVGPTNSDLDSQSETQVAMNARGDTVVAWSNREINAVANQLGRNDLETRFVQLRLYGPDGQAVSEVITASNTATDAVPRAPRVAIAEDGQVTMIWITEGQIRARHFAADGIALGLAYDINTVMADRAPDLPSLALAPTGGFAVAWEAFTFGNQPLGVQWRRYSGPNAPLGEPRTIAAPTSGLIERSVLTATASGDYLLVAHGLNQTHIAQLSADGSTRRVARFSNPGFASLFPTVADSGPGRATVAWQSFGQDGDGRGIYARELALD